MKYSFHISFETQFGGLHTLVHDFDFIGTKSAAKIKAREIKKSLQSLAIVQLPLHTVIYNNDLKKYL